MMQLREFMEDRAFSPALIADALRTTRSGIAGTLGLGKDAFSCASRIRARKTQTRLRQMMEILNRVEAATGSPLAAYAWFRSEPLPGFGDAMPDRLLCEGKAEPAHACLDRVTAGRCNRSLSAPMMWVPGPSSTRRTNGSDNRRA